MADQRFFTKLEKSSDNGQDFVVYNAMIVDGHIQMTENGLIHSFKALSEEKASNAAKSVHERYVELMK